MAWTTLLNALFLVDKPIIGSIGQALRDNPIAIAAGDIDAPVSAYGWHPYDMVSVGDGATGVLYDFAVDGVQATITSPDLEDGYEYRFGFDAVGHDGLAGRTFNVNFYRETAAAYSGVIAISGSILSAQTLTNYAELLAPRKTRFQHLMTFDWTATAATGGANLVDLNVIAPERIRVRHATPQKILRVQFSWALGAGSFSEGKAFMERRLYV